MAGTDYIDFKTMTGFTLEMVLAQINDMIAIASGYGGAVFGGYVRDVLVPRKFTPGCPVQFKDVDLWFSNGSACAKFLERMGDRLKIVTDFPVESDLYEFERQQYHLFSHGTCLAWVDVVVSKTFPVNDFDINYLIYRNRNGLGTFGTFSEVPVSKLMDRINSKTVRILPGYVKIITDGSNPNSHVHQRRVQERYLKRGWKVFYAREPYTGRPEDFIYWIRSLVRAERAKLENALLPGTSTPTASTSASNPIASSSTSSVPTPTASTSESMAGIFDMANKMMARMGYVAPAGTKMPTEAAVTEAINSVFNNPAYQNEIHELLSGQQSNDATIATAARIVGNSIPTPTTPLITPSTLTVNRKDLLSALESLEAAHRTIVKMLDA